LVVQLSSALTVGQQYGVRLNGASFARPFTCTQRYGFPEALLDGTKLGRRDVAPSSYHSNNPHFVVDCPIYRDPFTYSGVLPELNYIGILIVGFTTTNVIPFDNGQGTNQLLDSDYWLGATGGIGAQRMRGRVLMSVPLADDPALVGAVMKTQFAIFDGERFRLSEVVGSVIGDEP